MQNQKHILICIHVFRGQKVKKNYFPPPNPTPHPQPHAGVFTAQQVWQIRIRDLLEGPRAVGHPQSNGAADETAAQATGLVLHPFTEHNREYGKCQQQVTRNLRQ